MIDYTKPVRTVGTPGRPETKQSVEIKFTDGRGDYSVAGYVGDDDVLLNWMASGKYGAGSKADDFDLENYEPEQYEWRNIYERPDGTRYTAPTYGDDDGTRYRIIRHKLIGRRKIKLDATFDE